jgi:glucose/mannose-6-phosphate isomerase
VTRAPYLDTLGLWEAVAALPEQILVALDSAGAELGDARLPAAGSVRSVALLGVGAGGQAADAVAALAAGHSPVPIWVGRGYDVPAFVGPGTLAVALSRSGDVEETCSAAAAALERGAHVMAVCGGGALAALVSAAGSGVLSVPGDAAPSRAALGALTVPVLLALSALGLVPDPAPSLAAAAGALARRRDLFMEPGNPADVVARRIGRTIPLVYGSTGWCAVAAQRWKTQVNQNAKTPSFWAALPDLSHNEVAGWGQHGDVTRQVLSLVTLRHAGEHPHTARRFELVAQATDEVMADLIEVWAEGDDDVSRFFDLALFGDFVSLYVAGREGIDPGPVPATGDVRAGLG